SVVAVDRGVEVVGRYVPAVKAAGDEVARHQAQEPAQIGSGEHVSGSMLVKRVALDTDECTGARQNRESTGQHDRRLSRAQLEDTARLQSGHELVEEGQ